MTGNDARSAALFCFHGEIGGVNEACARKIHNLLLAKMIRVGIETFSAPFEGHLTNLKARKHRETSQQTKKKDIFSVDLVNSLGLVPHIHPFSVCAVGGDGAIECVSW